MKSVKLALLCPAVIFLLINCTKNNDPDPNEQPKLEGGKGGPYNLAFFSKKNGVDISSRMYIKYGADKMPADTTQYNDKMNTMVEPGYGPHTHFDGLTKGTYYIYAKSKDAQGDTVIVLTDASKKSQDIVLNLK